MNLKCHGFGLLLNSIWLLFFLYSYFNVYFFRKCFDFLFINEVRRILRYYFDHALFMNVENNLKERKCIFISSLIFRLLMVF